jgi:predicted alpha/beta hydrolase
VAIREWQKNHVVAQTFLAENSTFHIIWQSALGLNIRFYKPLAEALVAKGLSVTLIEQRGHGLSPIRSKRSTLFGIDELLDDVEAIYNELLQDYSSQQFVLAGHSLGGHLAILFAATRVNLPVLTVACALPFYKWFSVNIGIKVLFLISMIKTILPLIGYYPGHILGFGGKENMKLMRQWAAWAATGRYGEKYDQACLNWQGNLKGIDIEGDLMAPSSAAVKIRQLIPKANIERTSFTMVELRKGKEHSHWCRDGNVERFAGQFKNVVSAFE